LPSRKAEQLTFKRGNASEVVADIVPGAVLVGGAQLLLAADLLVVRVAEEALRADANGPVLVGLEPILLILISAGIFWTIFFILLHMYIKTKI
jgi:hypothetical protein